MSKLEGLALAVRDEGPWEHLGYDIISGPRGIICEVRGIGRNREQQIRDYLEAVSPEKVLALIAREAAARELLEQYVDNESCSFDHHGDCQTHGCSNPCRNHLALAWLEEAR